MRRGFWGLVWATLVLTPPAGAQTDAVTPPADPRPSWVVGMCSFSPRNVEARHLYLSHSIPLLLQERLLFADTHCYTEDERSTYRRHLLREEVRKLSGMLIRNRRQRDELYAGSGGGASRETSLERKNEQIRLLTDQIRALESMDIGLIDVADIKDVEFAQSTGSGALLAAPEFSPYRRAAAAGVDLLVFGRIEQIAEYLFVEVRALDYPRGDIVFSFQDALEVTEIYDVLDEVVTGLAEVVLGREWSTLVVRPSPPEAWVFVDSLFAGVGETTVEYAVPGLRTVEVGRRGFDPKSLVVELHPGERHVIEVALSPLELGEVAIGAVPYDSDVYVDSMWVGRTPVIVARPPDLARAVVAHEGYADSAARLGPATGAVDIGLTPGILTLEERRRRGKNGFYAAFGLWAVTLPLPVFAWAMSLDYAAAYRAAESAAAIQEQVRLARWYTGTYALYVGGLVVNLGLLTNTIISLLEYVRAADRPAG